MNGMTLKTLRKAVRDLKRRASMEDSSGRKVAVAVGELEGIERFLTGEERASIMPPVDPRDILREIGYKL